MRRFRAGLCLLILSAVAVTDVCRLLAADDAATEQIDLSQYYGFGPLEIFKLEHRSENMLAGDLNDDGLTDLVLIDNSHSRIDLLQQRKEQPDESIAEKPTSVNFISSGWRFEHRKIPVDKEISAMTLGDFNGDGRTDIACFGLPDRLIVRFQPKEGEWTESRSVRLPDVPQAAWNVAAGDLNHDGKDDVVVLGKNETFVLYQQDDGTLGSPKGLMNTSGKLALAQVADLDGDGRNDLCYTADDDSSRSLCARLQGEDGKLGAELSFELERPRAVSLYNLDREPGHEILAIDSRTGRARVFKLQRPEAKSGELAGRLVQYGFGRQESRDRDLATGDLDGDGLIDVVVTDPEAAQMIVFRQHKGQGLDLGEPFPGLMGAEHVRVADLDGDKSAEVVVLSTKEKTLGLSRFDGTRLTFPVTLPAVDEPVALELADFDGDGRLEIVYLARSREGRESKYAMRALRRGKEGGWAAHKFGDADHAKLELRGAPTKLVRLDANTDGRPDFLVFFGLDRAPQLLKLDEKGVPADVAEQGGIRLGDVSDGAVFFGQVNQKPAVLVARDNFARNLQLDDQQQWKVIDQYNAAESSARIVGVAALDLDGEAGNEIVLVDSGIKKLRVLRRQDNLFRHWKEVEIGGFPYKSSRVADLDGDGHDDLLLFGTGRFAVLYAGRTDPALKELASFETKLEKTYFADLVAGDLNGDGYADVATFDTRSHFVEILDFDAKQGLRHALHFKLFEEKSFADDNEGAGSDPRESVIADVTGDGRADLILLSHDRVLLFPQDTGAAAETAGK